jgi:periplasmic divalent cation tolerance protein
MKEISVVFCTVGDNESAQTLSEGLVSSRLAVCVNIIEKMKSIYYWQGEICREEEKLLIIKTLKTKVEDVFEYIKKNHSYDVPERISFSVNSAGNDYLKWANDYILDENQ